MVILLSDGLPKQAHTHSFDTALCRQFLCARCEVVVDICNHCDRDNRYCPACSPQARKESQTKAQSRYRTSEMGKKVRRLQAQRYRHVRKNQKTEGHHSSLLPTSVATPDTGVQAPLPEPETSTPDCRSEPSAHFPQSEFSDLCSQKTLRSQVSCDFCKQTFNSFQRLRGQWRHQKKNWIRLRSARAGPTS